MAFTWQEVDSDQYPRDISLVFTDPHENTANELECPDFSRLALYHLHMPNLRGTEGERKKLHCMGVWMWMCASSKQERR